MNSSKLESQNLKDYLVADTIVDWKSPAVHQKALELTQSLSTDVDRALCLYEWVRDEIPHSNDAGLDVLTCTASEVLQKQTGICFAKSHLLAAFLRGVNIPAGFCYQVLRLNPPIDNTLVLHGLNGIYLGSLGRWIRIDARGNTGSINAQFSLDKESLAFDMDDKAGEFLYDTIFSTPVTSVIEKLTRYKRRSDLWLDLPGAF